MDTTQENGAPPEQTQAISEDGQAPWAAAAQPVAPSPAGPSPAQQALAKAQNPDPNSIQTESPDISANAGSGPPGLVLRPAHGGLMGVVDKITDAIAGTTRPDIYEDQQGNKYLYHPNLTRGEQWQRVGAELISGAAKGLAVGQGPGGRARAIAAGVDNGMQLRQGEQQAERQMDADAQKSMLADANRQMLRMDMAEKSWSLARMKVQASQEDVNFANGQIDRFVKEGGTVLGTSEHPGDIAHILKVDPNLAENLVKNGIIETVPTITPEGHAGLTLIKMPNNWKSEMLPSGAVFHTFDPSTNTIVAHNASDAMTKGEQADLDTKAFSDQLAWKGKLAEIDQKSAEATNLNSEATVRNQEAPLKREETRANTAKSWAESHKANMEAEVARQGTGAESDDVDSQAQAMVDARTAPSLLPKRSKNYNAIMRRADELSMQQQGHKLDQQATEAKYRARTKLVEDFTDGNEAKSIESFDKFLGHAFEASTLVNALRNTDSRLINVPMNNISTLASTERSATLNAFLVKAETLRDEFQTMLKNNHALTVEDIQKGEKLLSENATPAQMQEAMKSMAHVASVRLRSSDFTYSRTMKAHVPDLISEDGARALQHFGVDPKSVYSSGGAQTQPGQQQQQQAPEQFQAVSSDGKWGYNGKEWVPRVNNGSK